MNRSRRACTRALSTALWVIAFAAVGGSAQAAVDVALTPANQTVIPGTDFDVFLDVTQAGSAFNGFDVAVGFDPSAVTPVPLTPIALQQGCLMTGECSAACGNAFHLFGTAAGIDSVSDVLLCNQVSLTGPGRLYRLRFHAENTLQITTISILRVKFYNAGLYVNPVNATSCQVGIGISVGVGTPPPGVARPLRVEPNPSFGRVNFRSEDDASGLAEVDILDLQGRVVQHLGPLWLASHAQFSWDGRDARGGSVRAGMYLVRVRRGGQVQNTRVILLP